MGQDLILGHDGSRRVLSDHKTGINAAALNKESRQAGVDVRIDHSFNTAARYVKFKDEVYWVNVIMYEVDPNWEG